MNKSFALMGALSLSIVFASAVTFPVGNRRVHAQETLIPITITITDVWDISEGDGIGQGCPDFFTLLEVNNTGPRQSSTVQGGGELSGCGGGYHILPPSDWEVTELVPLQQRIAKVSIAIWEEDFSSPNDHTDIDPGPGLDIEFDVDVRNGTWTGEGVQNPPKVEFPGTGCLSDKANGSSTGVGGGSVGVCWQVTVGGADTDGDGLLDHWETDGYYADSDNVVDVDLPRFGANPRHKDLFLELDTMPDVYPSHEELRRVKEAFAAAPINAGGFDNPDGLPGINLHIDTGPVTDAAGALIGDNLGGGNVITTTPMCGFDNNTFYQLKAQNFNPNRKPIFRYAISAPPTAMCDRGGQAELGGNDFVDNSQDDGTIMHELGHALGLDHGGFEGLNYKPNYVSVMNYFYSHRGIPRITSKGYEYVLDYSPPRHTGGRGSASLPEIVEYPLSEGNVLDLADSDNLFMFRNALGVTVTNHLNTQVDWNGDKDTNDSNLRVELTGESPGCDQQLDRCQTILGHSDWISISIPFLGFGDSNDGPVNPVIDPDPTVAEALQLERDINTTDLLLSRSSLHKEVVIGDLITLMFTVTNSGPNPAAHVVITEAFPAALTYIGGSLECAHAAMSLLTCDLGMMLPGDVRQLQITALVNAMLPDDSNGRSIVSSAATVANIDWPDFDWSNNVTTSTLDVVNYRALGNLQALYTFSEGSGNVVHDASGLSPLLNLSVTQPSLANWIKGGMSIKASTVLSSTSTASKVIAAPQATNELTIEAWFKPANLQQTGPARIVSLIGDHSGANFMLGQGRPSLPIADLIEVRLRTTATDEGGNPGLLTPNGTLSTTLTHVVVTRDASGKTRIYVNGQKRTERLISGDFSNWDQSFRLVLGNNLAGNSPWLGEYHLVAIYSRALTDSDVQRNFFAGPSGDKPVTTMLLPAILR